MDDQREMIIDDSAGFLPLGLGANEMVNARGRLDHLERCTHRSQQAALKSLDTADKQKALWQTQDSHCVDLHHVPCSHYARKLSRLPH